MKTKKHFLVFFIVCACTSQLNAQVEILSNDIVHIGNATNPQIIVNPNGTVHIGNTSVTPDPSIGFEVNVSNSVIKAPLWNGYVGVQFGAAIDVNEFGRTREVMLLTGLSNQRAGIGRSDNQMNKIYSSEYYLSGAALGPLVSSDAKLKTNVRELRSMTERISKLRPVMYDFVRDGSGEDVSKDPAYKIRVGFIAQEVKELFPDLVTTYKLGEDKDAEELLSLDYAGLIPYLTKVIQEQNERIRRLEQLLGFSTMDFDGDVADDVMGGDVPEAPQAAPQINHGTSENNILFQNVPNPFNNATTINYKLAENAINAKICIYNLTGKQLQCYNLPTAKGEDAVEVRASSLQSGMYLYSLIVDGKLIDAKRMILTE
ncbi:MAG: tail fiber domain-containing protein [Bacteroidales bacterium]|jgi:hypothetical protein|nr:tail fiber domain-containing protein [Bacteroidales bacterium]